jgi:hypothetical protein
MFKHFENNNNNDIGAHVKETQQRFYWSCMNDKYVVLHLRKSGHSLDVMG